MKHSTILLGVCLLVLCTAPVHALFAGDDEITGVWCPAEAGRFLEGSVLENDIPNTSPIIPVIVEEAKNGSVIVAPDGRVIYYPNYNLEDIILAGDSFRYRTFDGQDYSNVATVRIRLTPPFIYLPRGESLKFSTPEDTMLSALILDDYRLLEEIPYYSIPHHGILTVDISEEGWATSRFYYTPELGFEGIDRLEYRIGRDTGECGSMWGMPGTIEITVGNPNPVPEFPSAVLSAIFVIGFLGAVLLIRRTREN